MMQIYQADKKFNQKYGKLNLAKTMMKSSSQPVLKPIKKNSQPLIRESMYILPHLRDQTVRIINLYF